MRRCDRINGFLPDELILEVFRHLETKSCRDACSLVCKRWLSLERLGREIIRIGASASPEDLIKALSRSFPNIRCVFVDESIYVPQPVEQVIGSLIFVYASFSLKLISLSVGEITRRFVRIIIFILVCVI